MTRAVVFTIAVVCGILAGYLSLNKTTENNERTASNSLNLDTNEVLVASKKISTGDVLSRDNLKWTNWPTSSISSNFVIRDDNQSMEDVLGLTVSIDYDSEEPIQKKGLSKSNPNNLSTYLPQGKRAVALKISASITAGRFIHPGDRVDLVHTTLVHSEKSNNDMQAVSRIVLSNVKVLAIDSAIGQDADNSDFVGKMTTLEVEPHHVGLIASAERSGVVSLSLRSSADHHGISEVSPIDQPTNKTVKLIKAGVVEHILFEN